MKLNMFDAVTYSAVQGKKIVILLRVLEKASAAIFRQTLTPPSPRTAPLSLQAPHLWNCPRKR